jgi:hypothetical protein
MDSKLIIDGGFVETLTISPQVSACHSQVDPWGDEVVSGAEGAARPSPALTANR